MPTYHAPLAEFRFLLETLGYDGVHALPGFEDYDLDTVDAVLSAADVFCREVALPLNAVGDRVGVTLDAATGQVTMPDGFRALHEGFVTNGFGSLAHDPAHGGGGAPQSVALLVREIIAATNKSYSMCPSLTQGLVEAISHHGTDDQKARYLPKLVAGTWTGTMCLTEAHCGTDLGLLTTRAVPDGEGYRLTGSKIWITYGSHDMAENIVHLVLARLPDAPAGIKGISVFVVPNVLPDGTRNPIVCTGLEHKMGIHASPTCVMSLEGAWGELLGEPHRGMRAMFTMMNVARLNVGQEGVALSEAAYQTAVGFARERRQGRVPDGARREKNTAADVILGHPDVRRMLLDIRATTEAMRALGIYTSLQIDLSERGSDPEARRRATERVALLTPVIKSYSSERGVHNVSLAMQVCGGSGYTADFGIEQHLRDLRIAMIYEGTNHVQALDLAGRKLPADGGRAYHEWTADIRAFCEANAGTADLAELTAALSKALATLEPWSDGFVLGTADGEQVGATASAYLNAFALVSLGYMWGRMAAEGLRRADARGAVKLKLAGYFAQHVMPEVEVLARVAQGGKRHIMALSDDEF